MSQSKQYICVSLTDISKQTAVAVLEDDLIKASF